MIRKIQSYNNQSQISDQQNNGINNNQLFQTENMEARLKLEQTFRRQCFDSSNKNYQLYLTRALINIWQDKGKNNRRHVWVENCLMII